MSKFFSRTVQPQTRAVPSGDRIQKQYTRSTDLQGKACLKEIGTIDLQDHINSFKDETDINRILSRAANGDPTVLQRAQGIYCNVVGMPTNVHELHELIKRSESVFYAMPEEARAGKTFDQFLSSINNYSDLCKFADTKIAEAIEAAQRKTDIEGGAV